MLAAINEWRQARAEGNKYLPSWSNASASDSFQVKYLRNDVRNSSGVYRDLKRSIYLDMNSVNIRHFIARTFLAFSKTLQKKNSYLLLEALLFQLAYIEA